MAEEIRADLLVGRDSLTPGLLKAGRAAGDASSNLKQLTRDILEVSKQRATPVIDLKDAAATAKLDEIAGKLRDFGRATAQARVTVTDKEGQAKLAAWQIKLDKLSQKVISPRVTLEGLAKAEAELLAFDAELDRTGRKHETATVSISERLSKIGALKPSLLGSAAALSPALIPLAAGVGAAVAGIGASFGAAALGAGAFGKVATSVLASAGQDAAKLQAAQMRLNAANTAAAKKSAQQAIATLEAGWTKPYKQLIFDLRDFKTQWKSVSQSIAVPALLTWLHAIEDGLKFLKPLLDPVAGQFVIWGRDIQQYFTSRAGSDEITRIAAALGDLAATQLADLVTFIGGIGRGIAQLGKDAGVSAGAVSAIGDDFARWGPEFNTWAHSAAARRDVHGFLAYLHDNGGTVVSVLKHLAADMGTFARGAAGIGSLELKAVDAFLSLLDSLPDSVAKPLIEAAGALLLLSKTGVIKVGIKVAGLAANLLSGGTLTLGGDKAAASMRAAMVSGGEAAAAEIRAAMAGGGATAAAEETAGLAAGGGKFAAIGGTLGRVAGVAMAAYVVHAITSAIPGTGKSSFASGGSVAADERKQPGFIVKFDKALGLNTLAEQIDKNFSHPVRDFFERSLPGYAKTALGKITGDVASSSKAWDKAINPSIFDPFAKAAARATAAIQGDFGRQRQAAGAARSALGEYSTAIKQNGINSSEARSARQSLIRDLENAGVKSSTARGDVARYTAAVRSDGADSDAAHAARRRLITDIVSASGNSRQGRRDMNNLATAIQQHGAKSDAARAARQRLIHDLENSGLSARAAAKLVDEFSTAIRRIPKPQAVTIHAHGAGKTTFRVGTTGLVGAAGGAYVNAGTGPTADDVLARVSKGELIVPAKMVKAGAVDHLRGAIPGFESGGVIGSQAGTPPATGRWYIGQEDKADSMLAGFIGADVSRLIDQAKAKAAASAAGPTTASARQAQAYARSRLGAFGWGAAQMPSLISLWNGESGWNRLARNAASGAYGIPQALPASKMGAAANPPRSSAGAQINWGMGYIRSTYGSPSGAYSAWLSRSPHWYAKGGLVKGFASGGLVGEGRALMGRPHHGRPYNDQIAAISKEHRQDVLLSRARGLPAGTRHHYSALAGSLGVHLKILQHDASALRAWRHSLQGDDAAYSATAAAAKAHHLTAEHKRLTGYLKATEGRVKAVSLRLSGPPSKKKAGGGGAGGGGAGGSAATPPPPPPITVSDVASDFARLFATFPAVSPAATVTYGTFPAAGTYDRGGLLPPGLTMAVNNTGRPELVVPSRPAPAAAAGAGRGGDGEMTALLRRAVALLEAAPGRHGEALTRSLNGVARRAGASGMHAVRR